MAAGQERLLRRRIQTVRSTKKITHAMELIAASQIQRAQNRIRSARPYFAGMTSMVAEAARDARGTAGRLLAQPEDVRRTMVLVVVADRGLCGGYNSNILRAAERTLAHGDSEGREQTLVTVGRKAQGFFHYRGRRIDHAFSGMTDRPRYEDAQTVAPLLVDPFMAGEVDLVQVISMRFVSAGTQRVDVRDTLPLPAAPAAGETGTASATSPTSSALSTAEPAALASYEEALARHGAGPSSTGGYVEFEPESKDLLSLLVPRYAEALVFEALLEASASEHTSRQRAMASATENAEELIKTLSRRMNRARQDSITTEIMEIVSGAEALRRATAGTDARVEVVAE